MGKLLEGAAWFATLSLATGGTLAFLPDGAWETFPTALRPARAKLAEFGVAPTCYRVDNESTSELPASNGLTSDKDAVFWSGGTTVRIGERWKNVQKNGGVGFGDNASGNLGVGLNNAKSETREGGTAVEETGAFAWNGGDFNEGFGALTGGERNAGLNVGDSQPTANEGVGNVGLADENGDVDDWDADSIPPFDEGNGAAAEVAGDSLDERAFENVDNRSGADLAVGGGDNVAETGSVAQEKTAPSVAESAVATPQSVDGAVAGTGFEGFEGFNGFDAPTRLLAEADATLPSDLEEGGAGNVAPNSGAAGLETVDLQSALTAAGEATTPEEIKTAFETLNRIRNERGARLVAEEAQALDAALDRLAFDVFYNPAQAILEPRRQTAPGESLASIAERLGTTPETLAEINGLKTPVDAPLPVGTTLKTVRGPVSAEISIAKKELTLRFNGLYAGRFALGVPESSANLRGDFRVVEKLANPNCDAVDANGQTISIPGGAPENPLGAAWIALDGGVGLQGTNRPELVGQTIPENGGFVFSDREILQLSVLLPVGAVVAIVD
ncbi:MAG: LysM peptidoglycan-binding domain-containing protein [Thermoguttaceae bacterium]|nr:LysM peptidoglycan-binding domain-containing protein [Thermoguttaceae bacterium]